LHYTLTSYRVFLTSVLTQHLKILVCRHVIKTRGWLNCGTSDPWRASLAPTRTLRTSSFLATLSRRRPPPPKSISLFAGSIVPHSIRHELILRRLLGSCYRNSRLVRGQLPVLVPHCRDGQHFLQPFLGWYRALRCPLGPYTSYTIHYLFSGIYIYLGLSSHLGVLWTYVIIVIVSGELLKRRSASLASAVSRFTRRYSSVLSWLTSYR
jgi:hypothetical protein